MALRSPHDREILRLIVGHLARPQIAALGLAGAVLGAGFGVFNFLANGTTAVVARAAGAGQDERAARLAAQALWLSLGIAVALVAALEAALEAAAEPLLDGLGARGRSGEYALTYLRISARATPTARSRRPCG